MSGQLNIKPAFQAEKLEGKFKRTVIKIEEEVREVGATGDKRIITRKLVPVQEEYDGAYMVYFPQGHSIRIAADDVQQLQRIGVLADPGYVDMNTGEVIPPEFNLSPKDIVERKTRNRPRPSSQGGLSDLAQELGEE
jgi:hypothetical protein